MLAHPTCDWNSGTSNMLVRLFACVIAAQARAPRDRPNVARMIKPLKPVPPHTRVAVYHMFENLDDMQGPIRWLYATVATKHTPTNVFYNVGHTLVVRSHADVNAEFNTSCPCTLYRVGRVESSSQCRVQQSRVCLCARTFRRIYDNFRTLSCPVVGNEAMARAKAAGYDSIQIMHHDLDVGGRQPGQPNAKYEIIDLTSNSGTTNWIAGESLGRHFTDEHSRPCNVHARRANQGLEPLYFGQQRLLLSCANHTAHSDSKPRTIGTQLGRSRCANLTRRIRVVTLPPASSYCYTTKKGACDPRDASSFAKNGCAIRMPSRGFATFSERTNRSVKGCGLLQARRYGSCDLWI